MPHRNKKEYLRGYWKKNKARLTQVRREKFLKNAYDLTPDEALILAELQDHKCAGCGKVRPLQIDHDHETGKVRGLLCGPCNRALGLLGDSVDTLERLKQYVGGGQPAIPGQ